VSSRAWLVLPFLFVPLAIAFAACEDGPSGSTSGTSGSGGEGGCSPAPEALFTLTVTAPNGPVPADIEVRVTWSAGEEPAFELDDPSTWRTLEEGNVVCDVERDAGPPIELAALVCHLWTSGATRVAIEASGYVDYDETFAPEQSELCEHPIPRAIDVLLTPETDGGAR
jgi:hypothetical protein